MTSRKRAIDLLGLQFEELTVIAKAHAGNGGQHWKCRCNCGNESIVRGYNLRKGLTRSCGCLSVKNHPKTVPNRVQHGLRYDPHYILWRDIRKRTTNPKTVGYENYGARGIKMYSGWLKSPEPFIAHILSTIGPKPPGMQLDRIDNDKHYEPGNIRWATPRQNSSNTRRNIQFMWEGQSITLSDFMAQYGSAIEQKLVAQRIRRGWNPLDAVRLPLNARRPKDGYAMGLGLDF